MMRYLLTVILVACAPASASAQVDEARARFEVGERAYDARDYQTALEAFTDAYRMMEGHPNQGMILMNIARMHEELGHPAEARDAYRRFLAEAPENAPNRTVALERIAILEDSEGATSGATSQAPPAATTTATEGHFVNWIIAGVLVAVAAPAIAMPMWTLATEGECVEPDTNGCIERVQFGALDGVGLGLGITALIGAIVFAAGQPIQTQVEVSSEGAYVGLRGVF